MPLYATAPAGTLVLHISDDTLSLFGTAKRHEHLIKHDLIQHLEPRLLKMFSKDLRQTTVSLDEIPESIAPQ